MLHTILYRKYAIAFIVKIKNNYNNYKITVQNYEAIY